MNDQVCLVCKGSIEHVLVGSWALCSDKCTRIHIGQLKIENQGLTQQIVALLAERALQGELDPLEIPIDFGPED